MSNNNLDTELQNLEIIQEKIQSYKSNEFHNGLHGNNEEDAIKEDIRSMLVTVADNIKSVINNNDLDKEVITDYINDATDTQFDIASLICNVKIKKER